ncbi:MAG: hypothetical protein ACP5U2_01995, partial [Bryobacteraceae bacterium]
CWYPGPPHHRHYWRPALVAFFGFGVGGVHVGFGFGRIGWVPLAPYEPFYPWYGPRYYRGYRAPVYVDNSVRIVNNVQIINIYRNARVVNAISGADADGFVRGGRIQPLPATDAEIRRAALIQGPVPVVPARESIRFVDRPVRIAPPVVRSEPERFFARRPATPVERVPFEEQRRGMESMVRRVFAVPEQPAAPSARAGEAVRAAEPGRGAPGPAGAAARTDAGSLPRAEGVRVWRAETAPQPADQTENRGWRHIGEPARTQGAAESGAPAAGWRRVGEPVRGRDANLPRIESTETGQWQRFGAGATDAGNVPRNAGERGWRRFGEPLNRQPALAPGAPQAGAAAGAAHEPSTAPRERGGASRRQNDDEGWRRFAMPRSGVRRGELDAGPVTPPWGEPAWRSEPRNAEPRGPESRHAEPILINPPIVRERVAPRAEGGPRWGGEIRGEPVRPAGPRWGGVPRGGEIRGGEARGGGEIRGGGASRSAEGGARGGGRAGRPR